MRTRAHTTEAAALAMGTTSDQVKAWAGDFEQPERVHHAALLEYLRIDDDELRRLILRGQMRRAQSRIRN
jgi:hypothetical protein